MDWPVKLTCAQFTELSTGGLGDATVGRVRTDILRKLVTFLVIHTIRGACKTNHKDLSIVKLCESVSNDDDDDDKNYNDCFNNINILFITNSSFDDDYDDNDDDGDVSDNYIINVLMITFVFFIMH